MRGIAAVKPGNTTGHIGDAIQTLRRSASAAASCATSAATALGQVFHDRPNILHYGERGRRCRC